jgi:enamine deaminase RidA (YjgF/YER057c/UK114 family)
MQAWHSAEYLSKHAHGGLAGQGNRVDRHGHGRHDGDVPAELVRAAGLYPQAPYAYASVAAPGSLIFTAGACPIDAHGNVVGGADFSAQAGQAMSNLVAALAAAGAGLADVLKTTVYVASAERADLVAAWNVVSTAFGDHDAPSTLLGVSVLGYPGQLVEIEAVALAPAEGA